MHKILYLLKACLLITGVLFYMQKAKAQPTAISPEKYQNILGKGLDVDWWSRNPEKKNGNYTDKSVKDFSNKGIQHVRIRIHHYNFTERDFKRLDHQVQTCLDNNIIPIIAFSAKPYKSSPTPQEHNRVVHWWQKMAEHYSDISPLVSFNLIIEPSEKLKKENCELNSLYNDCVSVIRQTNPYRIIFIAPNNLSNPLRLTYLKIPKKGDGYIMAEWHFYASGPDKKNPKKKWTTGLKTEKNLITKKIEAAVSWQQQTGIFTWVGAWMPGNYNKGNDYSLTEQIVFSRFLRNELEKRNIPFAVNSDKVFYNYSEGKWEEKTANLFNTIFR